MKYYLKIMLTCILGIFAFISLDAQPKVEYKSLNEMIKNDPSVIYGKLSNGLTYYIKENKKPENRAELRLVVKAGSVLEDDDQQGLAHFCEHMMFNGTKNFPKSALIDFLEKTGMRFGADLNAYTGFDETVYYLEIPMDKEGLLDNGFQVLQDWAMNASFESEEIDKERGVIMEEWRLGKGAEDRMMNKQLPIILYNSKYAKRLPIGDTNVILRANYETLKRFYKEWYRPELMAVICVGDFKKEDIEAKVKQFFSVLTNPANPRKREQFSIPEAGKPLVTIASDKEASYTAMQLYFKKKMRERGTFADYRQGIIDQLFSMMLSNRLQELTKKSSPPFLYSLAQEGEFIGDVRVMIGVAIVNPDSIMKGYNALVTEFFRVIQNGFTQTELDRNKIDIQRSMEKSVKEKDKTPTNAYAGELQRHFIDNESYPGIEVELELYKKFLPEIKLDEINEYVRNYININNSVIVLSCKASETAVIPTENQLLTAFNDISKKKLEPYKDEVSDKPIFNRLVEPGTVTSEKTIKELGVTEWKLSNGATVYLKPTDFKNDEILIEAISPGGTSMTGDNNYMSASNAASIINESGISEFNSTQLEKMLSGKIVRLSPYITDEFEGLSGGCSPEDLETEMQLLHLYFAEPGKDKEAFAAYIENLMTQVQSSKDNPDQAFYDTVQSVMSSWHFRAKPLNEEMVKSIRLDSAYSFYKKRFADAGDFTFFIVGSFTPDSIKPLVEKYIASLRAKNSKEKWIDRGERVPKTKITKEIKKGIEPKSTVRLSFTGDFDYTRENRFKLNALMEVLDIQLREAIREDKSGTYGIYAFARMKKIPVGEYSVNIGFGCSPDRVDELINSVMEVLDNARKNAPKDDYMIKVKEILRREREKSLKENNYWLGSLVAYYKNGENFLDFLKYEELIEKLKPNDIKDAAKKYLNNDRLIKFILYPEK
jgi:zinc protease